MHDEPPLVEDPRTFPGAMLLDPTPSPNPRNQVIPTFTKLLVFQAIGEVCARALSLPIPGPVIGMVCLLIYLMLKDGEAAKLEPTASSLLSYLPLFFVPAAVGILVHVQRVASEWLPIAAALVSSTVASIIVTALVMRWLQK